MPTTTPRSGAPKPSRFKTASPPLTRAEILDAALRLAEAGDLDQLTLRKLADELDVTPMALYRHVRDKDDIIEGVADALLAEQGLPRKSLHWEAYLIELARSLRAVLRDHPVIVTVFTRRPQVGPAARVRLEAARQVLVGAGFREHDALSVYAAVHTYTLGFCALEAGRAASTGLPPDEIEDDADDDLPRLIAAFVSEQQFEFGLRSLARGLPAPRRGRGSKSPAARGG
jgi:AcrR family transcriptional regulator